MGLVCSTQQGNGGIYLSLEVILLCKDCPDNMLSNLFLSVTRNQ